MARSESGFEFPVDFMTPEDTQQITKDIVAVDSYWCSEDIYTPASDWSKEVLMIDDSGIGYDSIEKMVDVYVNFVKEHYPEANVYATAYYNQLNAEGTFKWEIYIDNGKAEIEFLSAPMNYPTWCNECEDWLEFNIDDLTLKNYKKYKIKCPKCGKVISPYKDYGIEIFKETR